MGLSDALLAAAITLFLLAALALGWTIANLVRTLRGSIVASLPLSPEQKITLPHAGAYDLYVEGARFSMDFRRIAFEVHDAGHAPVALRPSIFRTTVSGRRRVRLRLASFEAPAAGIHALRLNGIQPDQDPANRIVVATPVTAKVVAHILAIVALGLLLMASVGGALITQLQ